MFRRIELIGGMTSDDHRDIVKVVTESGDFDKSDLMRYLKTGLMGSDSDALWNAWVKMPNPRRWIGRGCRFYFTEAGWRLYGRPTIRVCQRIGRSYRVIAVKEKSVEVIYRDEVQVAVRPRKIKQKRLEHRARKENP
jgi:hypothetical protein